MKVGPLCRSTQQLMIWPYVKTGYCIGGPVRLDVAKGGRLGFRLEVCKDGQLGLRQLRLCGAWQLSLCGARQLRQAIASLAIETTPSSGDSTGPRENSQASTFEM